MTILASWAIADAFREVQAGNFVATTTGGLLRLIEGRARELQDQMPEIHKAEIIGSRRAAGVHIIMARPASRLLPIQDLVRHDEYQRVVDLRDDALTLLDETRQCFTRDDDLPGDLLQRIDALVDARPDADAGDDALSACPESGCTQTDGEPCTFEKCPQRGPQG